LDASILAQKSEFVQLNFPQTSAPKQQTVARLTELMDPYLDHPKSSMVCIKCIKMIMKQWLGCHDGWMPELLLKSQNLPC
jgi:hypothetical protein